MIPTVQHVLELIDSAAPFQTAEEYDNVGLLIGRREEKVTKILLALDCTLAVVEEAAELGAELILTHHPLFFHARKHLREEDGEAKVICALIRNRLSLISAHTNLDRAPGGINDVLGQLFSLKDMQGNGFLRSGRLPVSLSAKALKELAFQLLHAPVRLYGDPDAIIQVLAVGSGAYGEGFKEAVSMGAQAYLTGEIHHHDAVAAAIEGIVLLEAGHYATEAPGLQAFGGCLQKTLDGLQYEVGIHFSKLLPYPGALSH